MGVKYEEYEIPESILEGNANAKRIESRFNKLLSVEKFQESYKIAKCDTITRMSYNEQILKYCRDGILILDVLIAEVNQVLMQAGISAIKPVDIELFKVNHFFSSFYQDVAFISISATALESSEIKLGESKSRLNCSDEVEEKQSEPLSPSQMTAIRHTLAERKSDENLERYIKSNYPQSFQFWQQVLSNGLFLSEYFKGKCTYSDAQYQNYTSIINELSQFKQVELKSKDEFFTLIRAGSNGELPIYRNDIQLLSILCSFEGLL